MSGITRIRPAIVTSTALALVLAFGLPTASTADASSPLALHNKQASEGGDAVNETAIAARPGSRTQLLSGGNDFNCSSWLGFYASSDGGQSWLHHCLPIADGCFHPALAYGMDGAAYIAGTDCSGIVFQKSVDNGITWSPPANAVRPILPNGIVLKGWMDADLSPNSPFAGSLYISATQTDAARYGWQISVTHSRDVGPTWSTVAVDTEQVPVTVES